MRRRQTSVLILGVALMVTSLLYLLLPADPITSAIERAVFGVDNMFTAGPNRVDSTESNRVSELEAENQRLRSQLNFHNDDQSALIAGSIVSKSVQNYTATIDVDIGSDVGVKRGQPVVSQGQLIGRVESVNGNRSRILLLSDPSFRAAVVVEGTNLDGLVRPVPGGLVIEQVPGAVPGRAIGNRVETSGLGGVFPPGILVGMLGDDVSDEGAIFRQYALESTVDIGSLREVFVLQ